GFTEECGCGLFAAPVILCVNLEKSSTAKDTKDTKILNRRLRVTFVSFCLLFLLVARQGGRRSRFGCCGIEDSQEVNMGNKRSRLGYVSHERRAGIGERIGHTMTLVNGMVIGAGIMYVFDPQRGATRRSYARDKLIR